MNTIFKVLAAVCALLIYGIVGGVDADTIPLGQAVLWEVLLIAAFLGCVWICSKTKKTK